MLSESWRPSLKHAHTQTHTTCRVCLYLSQLFTHRRQQRKKGSEQNREGQKQKRKEEKREKSGREKERNGAEGLLKNDGYGESNGDGKDTEESGQSERNLKKYKERLTEKERRRRVRQRWRVEEKKRDTMGIKERKKAAVFSTSLLAEASVTLSGLLDPHGNKNQHVCLKCFH